MTSHGLMLALMTLSSQASQEERLRAAEQRIEELEAENARLRSLLGENAKSTAQEPAQSAAVEPTAPLVNFSGFSIQYLNGFNWQLGQSRRDIATLEYFNDNRWGDLFTFVDVLDIITEDRDTPVNFYGEISPRFSLNKLFDADLSFGPVKEVLTTHTVGLGSNAAGDPFNHLHGLGANLDVPGFKVAQVNAYLRDDTDLAGQTWQVTLAWLYPFQIGELDLSFGGFVDVAGPEGASEFNILSDAQLLLDAGKLFYDRPGEAFLGVEFTVWHNEFGIAGQDEFVPQVMAKFAF